MNIQPKVLVVDDEVRSQEALKRTLFDEFDVFTASGASAARAIMEREAIEVILCDQRMPDVTGVAFLREVRTLWPDTARIIISGYTESEDIIAAINDAGIYQYMLKPWQPDQLVLTVRAASQLFRLQQENHQLNLELRSAVPIVSRRIERKRAEVKQQFDVGRLVRAPTSPLNAVCRTVEQVAGFDIPILITGESGTGKELLARAIHYGSRRADKPFVVENCGALSDQLLESELFGHKRGAFTGAYEDRIGLFQQADGGTIFLDEIGDTSPALQVKLLRALQEGEIRPLGSSRSINVDVRAISATHRDLEDDVRTGRFREDLYYRLTTMTVHLAPLRERPMDIAPIAERILDRAMKSLGKQVQGFTDEAMQCLKAYRWPGNVRELQNEVVRMLALAQGSTLGADLLSPRVLHAATEEDAPVLRALSSGDGPLKDRLEALEAQLLKETLIRHRWNKSKAASELGLSRVGLRGKLSRYKLERSSG